MSVLIAKRGRENLDYRRMSLAVLVLSLRGKDVLKTVVSVKVFAGRAVYGRRATSAQVMESET